MKCTRNLPLPLSQSHTPEGHTPAGLTAPAWHSGLLEEPQGAELVWEPLGNDIRISLHIWAQSRKMPVSYPCLPEKSKCPWVQPLAQGLPDGLRPRCPSR